MIVTVVTPTLNAREYLVDCIQSVQRNEGHGVRIEHVIVDGGSTDGTAELAEAQGLRVLKGKDHGIFDAINKGSFASTGELLGFLGADDMMLDGAMEAVVSAYRESGKRWVVGGIRWIDSSGFYLGELAAPPTWMTPRMHACLGWNPIMHMGTYISRAFFTELRGFDIGFRDAGDYELFARALSKAPYERLARPVACFRRTGQNNSVIQGARAARECAEVLSIFGPKSTTERLCWQHLLKIWFNVRNPGWSMRKVFAPLRIGLRLQEKSHF